MIKGFLTGKKQLFWYDFYTLNSWILALLIRRWVKSF